MLSNAPAARSIDVHQHLWPPEFLDALRSRRIPPFLDGWTLHLDGEPPYEVQPAHHDVDIRQSDVSHLALVSLSSPLGVEYLHPAESEPLLKAWHNGAARLPERFGAWASVSALDPDLGALRAHLTSPFVGLQLPAGLLATPDSVDRLAPVLDVVAQADRPVFVHPGPVRFPAATAPGWWAAVVDYPAQLAAAWWAWSVAGRPNHPGLRMCFAAGAGLGPLHHERLQARAAAAMPEGGTSPAGSHPGQSARRSISSTRVDTCTYVDTSSYGPQALDGLIRALGIDALVFGSDRPYAPTTVPGYFGEAAARAVHVTNPNRLLEGRHDIHSTADRRSARPARPGAGRHPTIERAVPAGRD